MSESPADGGFCPGAGIRGVDSPPTFPDAADLLIDSESSEQPSGARGVLLLADGTRFEGRLFGSEEIQRVSWISLLGCADIKRALPTHPSPAKS